MTAQRDADIDIESLRKNLRRPLDAFLLVSITVLFLAVAAVFALVMVLLKQPQLIAVPGTRDSFQAAYKMSNFVYLEASSSELANCTMGFNVVEHGNGTSKGSNFDFNPEHYSLKPKQAGTYFIYVKLNLTCTHRGNCSKGRLTVQVGDKLTCEVDLLPEKPHIAENCWTVSQVNNQKLLTQMTITTTGLNNWKLDLKGSGLGMFLVD